MKKVVSLFLALLLLLNVLGYYGIFLGLKYSNSRQVTQRLDANNYTQSETVTLKIPMTIPYYGDTDFERVDGEIEHKGEFYRLVKQKLEKDTLHIVCIRDIKSKHLQQALEDYVKTFADQSTDRSNTKTSYSFIKDYVQACFHLEDSAAGWSLMFHYHDVEKSFSTPGLPFPTPPPKA